jgi:hypothetical protein
LSSEVAKNHSINHGNIFDKFKFMELSALTTDFFFCIAIIIENIIDIGIIRVVLVSLTMVEYSPAMLLKAYPAATTDEVSLIAVPAHIQRLYLKA